MPTTRFAPTSDLPMWAVVLACALALASFALLLVEMRRRERGGALIVGTGVVAVAALLFAVLRPVKIAARESVVGARVVVLADTSRSMALPGDNGGARLAERDKALASLEKNAHDARLLVLGFGDGAPRPLETADGVSSTGKPRPSDARAPRSDLATALNALASSPDEHPASVVVVSDGRLDDPAEGASEDSLRALGAELHVPINTIATSRSSPPDASVRHVAAAGAAVAHVPMPLRVEIGCSGGLSCDELTVTARELRDDGPPALLASGLAHVKDGKATVDLTVTMERAGARILEVAITPPSGDTIPENDRRLLTFNVSRERVRVLHVAGRPTNDVRELRMWLKSDASLDIVAFFILRTTSDVANATDDELALIPFPVDELFTEHLPSFDAVVLQDIDANEYRLSQHLGALAKYVKSGGGLIMVGGPTAFLRGGYAGTPIATVLPVELDESRGATADDATPFVPRWTDQGHAAPLLKPLRDVVGEDLPQMAGTNVLGDVRPGGVVLWTHPTRTTKRGAPMPVLAIGDEGDGRSIALGIDSLWTLKFSELGARTAGRGHGALWDGLLGWLMRDPRFEPAQIEIVNGDDARGANRSSSGACTAGLPSTLRAQVLPAASGAPNEPISIDVMQIDRSSGAQPLHFEAKRASPEDTTLDFPLPPLAAGGYTARLRVGTGSSTRRDFACEAGGDEWADSRPDPDRLRALASATGGKFAFASDAAEIPFPKATVVSAERHVVPLAPPWAWALLAAAALGGHWIARRRSGLA
ncbi:MAG: glutamine amidotransferase [Polyangiaceae bacterium]